MSDAQISIIVPTRGRAAYLDVALESIAAQAATPRAELIVVDDGPNAETAAVARRHGARLVRTGAVRGANAARNLGVEASRGELVVFVDDDVLAPLGWLTALIDAALRNPGHDVFGGPIRAVIEGGPRSCGRERAPITTLDLGVADRDAELVWSANMAVRREALARTGPFDESIHGRGEEEEWERRLTARGGRIRYVAAAGLDHRRVGPDARLTALARAQYALGRSARVNDVRKGAEPTLAGELETLLRTLWHVARYRCPGMLATTAHSVGRLREAMAKRR